MALTNQEIQEKVTAKFGEAVASFTEPYDMLTFEVSRDKAIELMQFLRDDETLRFNFLTTLGGIHFPDNEVERQFVVLYQTHVNRRIDG